VNLNLNNLIVVHCLNPRGIKALLNNMYRIRAEGAYGHAEACQSLLHA